MVCKKMEACEILITHNEFVDFCCDDDGYLEPWCPLNKSRELLKHPQDWLKTNESARAREVKI